MNDSSPNDEPPVDQDESPEPSWRDLLSQFRYVVILSLIFIGMSIVYAIVYFPELGTARAVFAGLTFGVFCSMCAATYSQLI